MKAECFLIVLRACRSQDTQSGRKGLELGGSQGKVGKTGTSCWLKATCSLCHLWTVRLRAGCWLQLHFVSLLGFIFLKTVAFTLFFHSQCGMEHYISVWKNIMHFCPVLLAVPTTLWCHCSVIFPNLLISKTFLPWFYPVVTGNFFLLLTADLESFSFSPLPLLFGLLILGNMSKNTSA